MRNVIVPALLAFVLGGCGGGDSRFGARNEFILSGTVTYEDREYGRLTADEPRYGFTATDEKPVRFATVQVVNASGRVIAQSGTDDLGNYTITASGGTNESMRLRVLARTRTRASVSIRDLSGNLFPVSKGFQTATARVALGVSITGDLAGAFNMLDVYAAAGEFVQEKSGRLPPELAVYWQPGSQTQLDTTLFCNSGAAPAIYVLGGSYTGGATVGDADHFDDDVLLHEYGHFLEHSFGVLDSKGGHHTLFDTNQDLRLSWSEGFSSFLAGAIKSWLAERWHDTLSSKGIPHSFYMDAVDGVATPGKGLYFDFRSIPPDLNATLRYATNETATAKVLWNLHADGAGMDSLWEAFSNGLPHTSATLPASLETFWDAWQTSDAAFHRNKSPSTPLPREAWTTAMMPRNRMTILPS